MFRIIYGVILGGFLSYLLLIASMTYSSSVQTKLIDEPVTGLRGYVYDYLVRYNTTIPFNKGYFFPEKNDKTGVVLDNPEKSWGEYTVYNSADTHAVSVINRGGTEVFSWDASIFKIWPEETKDIITKTPEFSFTAMARNFLDKYHPGNIYVMQGGHKLYLGLVKEFLEPLLKF